MDFSWNNDSVKGAIFGGNSWRGKNIVMDQEHTDPKQMELRSQLQRA